MRFLKFGLLATLSTLLLSCFDSDEHIFDETESIEITVVASLAKSATPVVPSVKADTFHIDDTIYFQTTIVPNKIVLVQDYRWLMDGEYCSSEYNFKQQIKKPGYHKFMFVLKDHFGDMHYDSLDVWVSDKPALNDSVFVPAQGTQAIDPYETIYFAWSASTPGIRLAHKFRFTLSEEDFANTESKFKALDTLLSDPNFTFRNKLNPLRKYNWTVQAINEYGLVSHEKIESSFYTKGLPGEGSLQAAIKINHETPIPTHATLQDQNNGKKVFNYSFSLSNSENVISLGSIPAGKYKLNLDSDYPDFGSIQKDVEIHDGYVTIASNLKLIDSIAPSITSVSALDTLEFKDSLQFIIKDGSKSISIKNISASLEDEKITSIFLKDSILTVVLDETEKSWTYRILNISATDGSKNTGTKSFYISPSIYWFTTNNDTTVYIDDIIRLTITDHNPYRFEVDSLKFYNVTKNEEIISIQANGSNTFSAKLSADLFEEHQVIQSTVIYANGYVQSKNWTLTVKDDSSKEEE